MPFTKTEKIVTTTIEETHATFDRVEEYKKGPKAELTPDVTDGLAGRYREGQEGPE